MTHINAKIDYEPVSWQNNGIGYFLREKLFNDYSQYKTMRLIYRILDVFV